MDRAPIKRILVRGPNWLGDAVMCEPALRGLRRLFPDAQIALLVKPAVADLYAGHPALTRVLTYDTKGRHAGLFGKWALAGQLRRQHFDLAVLFQNAFEAAFLTFLAGVPRRYGYATDGRSLLLSDPVTAPDRRSLLHQVHYYWDLLKPLGVMGDPSAPELVVFPEEEQAMARRFAQAGLIPTDVVVGINPARRTVRPNVGCPNGLQRSQNDSAARFASLVINTSAWSFLGRRGKSAWVRRLRLVCRPDPWSCPGRRRSVN